MQHCDSVSFTCGRRAHELPLHREYLYVHSYTGTTRHAILYNATASNIIIIIFSNLNKRGRGTIERVGGFFFFRNRPSLLQFVVGYEKPSARPRFCNTFLENIIIIFVCRILQLRGGGVFGGDYNNKWLEIFCSNQI